MVYGTTPSRTRLGWALTLATLSLPSPALAQSGWADLHAHPASHLGFGHKPAETGGDLCEADEGIFHGEPGSVFDPANPDFGIEYDLTKCEPETHAPCTNPNPVQKRVRTLILNVLESGFGSHTPYGFSSDGSQSFSSWPHAGSRTHQQMHLKWLHRAWQGGQRLMIASVTDNELLAKWYHDDHECTDGAPKPSPHYDYESAKAQIAFIMELFDGGDRRAPEYDEANDPNDWIDIAFSADEADGIIKGGDMAVILGVELDSLTLDEMESLISDHGVRSVLPVHMVNNEFGGTATYDDMFNALNYWKNGEFFKVEADAALSFRLGHPQIPSESDVTPALLCPTLIADVSDEAYADTRYACLADFPRTGCIPDGFGHKNEAGLRGGGSALESLMKMEGLLIDVAHMGEHSVDDTIALAQRMHYPLIDSHTGVRDPAASPGGSERAITVAQARAIAALGGIIGLGTEGDVRPRRMVKLASAPVVRLTGGAPEFRSYLEPDDASRTGHRMESLRVRIQTGGDDLRGGGIGAPSRARLRLTLATPGAGGRTSYVHDLSPDSGWGSGTLHEVVWNLGDADGPGAMAPSQLRAATLEFASGGGWTDGDTWDVEHVQIEYRGADATGRRVAGLLIERDGNPYRTLGHGAAVTMTTVRRSAETRRESLRTTRVGTVSFSFRTGGDDLSAPAAVVITTYDGRTIERDIRRLDGFVGAFTPGASASGDLDLRSGRPLLYGDIASIHVHNREGGDAVDFDNWDLDRVQIKFRPCADAACRTLGATQTLVDRDVAELAGTPSLRANMDAPARVLWHGLGEPFGRDEVLRRIGARIRTGRDDLRAGSFATLVLWLQDGSERTFELNHGALWDGHELETEKVIHNLTVGGATVRMRDVVAIGLRFRGDGHDAETHDNWNVNLFEVSLESDPVTNWLASFGVAFEAARKGGRAVMAIGTDLNGLQPQLPFTELQQTKGLKNLPEEFQVPPGDTTGGRSFTLEHDGIAHYGMLPDFLDAVVGTGSADTRVLLDSAGATVETWHAAERAAAALRKRPLTARASQSEAAGCSAYGARAQGTSVFVTALVLVGFALRRRGRRARHSSL